MAAHPIGMGVPPVFHAAEKALPRAASSGAVVRNALTALRAAFDQVRFNDHYSRIRFLSDIRRRF